MIKICAECLHSIYNFKYVTPNVIETDMNNNMINFNNKKTRKIFSSVLIIILVLAMVVPVVVSAFIR